MRSSWQHRPFSSSSAWQLRFSTAIPFDKLISLSVLIAGVFPFIVDRGLLDVAIALALIAPLSTIFILMACQRRAPS